MLGPKTLQRALLGRPLPTAAAAEERLTRPRAIGAFGLDALSSVAYGPDEILYVLLLAGAAGARWDIPIALAIAALLVIVAASYRQTIYAYPHGGGSFTVARENLGTNAGLVAAAALMIDYLTTVAVSVTAGVQAIIAFAPVLDRHRVTADLACILLLVLVNLRGIREAGAAFVLPTYLFIGSLGLLLGMGIVRVLAFGDVPLAHPVPPAAVEPLGLFVILRAFAGGCTAMTGIEAIANGVPVFKRPESRNAAATLTTLTVILGTLFLATNWLGHHIAAIPTDQANVIAQIGRAVATGPLTPLFYLVQLSAAVILLLAANTSFNGFPLLAAVMAREGYFPHQFQNRGQRLAYSNGILVIGMLAAVLVVAFHGSTHALIPLFAVGVFCCFTLSQAGMVRHWQRTRGARWRGKLAVNATGATVTGVVTVVVVVTKFSQGAWVVVLLVPLLAVNFAGIHAHYERARRELALGPPPKRREPQRILVPVNRLNRAVAETLEYALSISDEVRAVHLAVDPDKAKALERAWQRWGVEVPLQIVPCPYREVVPQLVELVERVQAEEPRRGLTVMVPEVVPHRWWEEPLHNQTAFALELALRYRPGIVVTTVPVRLRR